MSIASTPESTGLSVADAAEQLEALLGRQADSEGDETEEETPQTEEEDPSDDEDETDPEEQDAEDEETEEQDPEPKTFTVKVDGEDVSVTQEELLRGYSREADYTRKTQQLSESRKAFETEQAEFAPLAERTRTLLEQLEQNLQAPMYDEQELAELRISDPAEFAARVAEIQLRQGQVAAVQAEKQRLADAQAKQEASQLAATRAQTEAELLKARPEWRDPAKLQADFSAIQSVAQSIGLTEDEWKALALDHRSILVLDEAAKYRALQAKKPQVKERIEAVKTARPGTTTQPVSKVTEVTRAKQRLAKTGRVDDAALAIERMMK